MHRFTLWCLLVIALQSTTALKCRSENQQMDMRFEKVLQICKRRSSAMNSSDSYSRSTESSSSESNSNSDEDIFSKNFFSKNQPSNSNNQRDRFYRNGQSFKERNRLVNSYNYNRTDGNRRNSQGSTARRMRNEQSTYAKQYNNNRNNNAFDKTDDNQNYFNRDQACVIQCFFNEFNAVDQKGFPVKDSVVRLMSQNIQDPELHDFIEESVIECFRYLRPVSRRDNCEFSQNLITCLADKGKERCEDWEE